MGPHADGRPARGAPRPRPQSVAIRPATGDEAAAAARLHASGIDEGFLSVLGTRFLARLYARIRREPGSFVLVAVAPGPSSDPGPVAPDGPEGDVVAGFVAGSADVRRLYRTFLVRDGVAAALPASVRLLRRLPRVIETLRHGTTGDAGSGRGTELLAVAVDPVHRRAGVGRALVAAFLDEVVARGGNAAHVVVGASNAAAVQMYRDAGFVEHGRFELHHGTDSLLLQWERSDVTGQ